MLQLTCGVSRSRAGSRTRSRLDLHMQVIWLPPIREYPRLTRNIGPSGLGSAPLRAGRKLARQSGRAPSATACFGQHILLPEERYLSTIGMDRSTAYGTTAEDARSRSDVHSPLRGRRKNPAWWPHQPLGAIRLRLRGRREPQGVINIRS